MEIKQLIEKLKKHKLKEVFTGKKYITVGQTIYWKNNDRWYDEKPLNEKEDDDNVLFVINIEDFYNELFSKNNNLNKTEILNLYKDIIDEEWNIFIKDIKKNHPNKINFSNKLLQDKIKYLMNKDVIFLLGKNQIIELIELVNENIKQKGVLNENYSILFDILSGFESCVDKEYNKEHKEIYELAKNAIFKVIVENPDFYNEKRKFYTYKKLICDVTIYKENKQIEKEFCDLMDLKLDLRYFLLKKDVDKIIIEPNWEYEFLEKFNDKFKNFDKTVMIVSNLLLTLKAKNQINYSLLELNKKKHEYHNKSFLELKIDKNEDLDVLQEKINHLFEILMNKKDFTKELSKISNVDLNDKVIQYYINQHIDELVSNAREIDLKNLTKNNNGVVNNKLKI